MLLFSYTQAGIWLGFPALIAILAYRSMVDEGPGAAQRHDESPLSPEKAAGRRLVVTVNPETTLLYVLHAEPSSVEPPKMAAAREDVSRAWAVCQHAGLG